MAPPHLSLNLSGYTIFREDCHQRRGGGVLALRDTLVHSQLHLPQRQDGHLEVVAARISLRSGRLTMAVFYNPGGAESYQDYEHYSPLPPPVLIMGDFNTHHLHWDPTLPPNHRNTSDNTLHQVLINSLHLSLVSLPGLATRFHPHTAAPLVLDLFLGDPAFNTCTFSTGPYMGSDHLPLLVTLPNASPRPRSGCLPRLRVAEV